MSEDKIIKDDLKSLIKRFSKSNVVSEIAFNYSKDSIKYVLNTSINDNVFLKDIAYSDKELAETTQSIKEKNFYNPLIVRNAVNGLEIILGRKRLLASKAIGEMEVPVIVKEMSDQETLLIILVDLKKNRDSNSYEIAKICKILNEKYGYKYKDLASILSCSISQISNLVSMLRLPEYMLKEIGKGRFTYGHAKAISRLPIRDAEKIYEGILAEKLSVRECEQMVEAIKKNDFKKEKNITVFKNKLVVKYESLNELEDTLKRLLINIKEGRYGDYEK
jgi:ParB family chromosome partitioning protein